MTLPAVLPLPSITYTQNNPNGTPWFIRIIVTNGFNIIHSTPVGKRTRLLLSAISAPQSLLVSAAQITTLFFGFGITATPGALAAFGAVTLFLPQSTTSVKPNQDFTVNIPWGNGIVNNPDTENSVAYSIALNTITNSAIVMYCYGVDE